MKGFFSSFKKAEAGIITGIIQKRLIRSFLFIDTRKGCLSLFTFMIYGKSFVVIHLLKKKTLQRKCLFYEIIK